jgi:hypothetical protein
MTEIVTLLIKHVCEISCESADIAALSVQDVSQFIDSDRHVMQTDRWTLSLTWCRLNDALLVQCSQLKESVAAAKTC